jgi:hypothetical protein
VSWRSCSRLAGDQGAADFLATERRRHLLDDGLGLFDRRRPWQFEHAHVGAEQQALERGV